MLFGHGYNDTTNAFKAYRREVITTVQPLLSHHFNLTVELPLKAVVRGHSYAIVPIRWRNRAAGESKLRLKEMGSRYLFIVLYVFFEHHLSRGDYRRAGAQWRGGPSRRWHAGSPAARILYDPEAARRRNPRSERRHPTALIGSAAELEPQPRSARAHTLTAVSLPRRAGSSPAALLLWATHDLSYLMDEWDLIQYRWPGDARTRSSSLTTST